ncbi:glycoside hydrolase family 45 protein [Myriangium duriaei CBS 260.36]|uniref:Cellulase n=1 Tax=Myriangium duriaei CBS 260.36 TaxID=1168546 RepID=A0A9P4JA67_9PEZI|nr:glycoside hydrolase family 45 protein [Myriangium duriaei CBS 260.36]
MSFKAVALLALATGFATVANAQSGTGTTTRYWDCCKPSCSWGGKALVSSPVQQCDKNNSPLTGGDSNQSACNGGDAYMCADQTPQVNPSNPLQAFGFAAANVGGASESDTCCGCYELTFTSTSLATAGKSMIVQVTNTGSDLVQNQFDLAFPGGGVGIFNACSNQYGSFPLGAQYGGITDGSLCDQYPAALQAGCKFRFGWFEGADNPTVSYKKVTCPAALTAKTGCVRNGEGTTGSSGASASSSTVAAASSSSSTSAYQAPSSSTTTTTVAPTTTTTTVAPSSSAATTTLSTYQSASTTTTDVPSSSAATTTLSTYQSPSTTTTTSAAGATTTTSASLSAYTPPANSSSSKTHKSHKTHKTTTTTSAGASAASDCGVQYVTLYDL